MIEAERISERPHKYEGLCIEGPKAGQSLASTDTKHTCVMRNAHIPGASYSNFTYLHYTIALASGKRLGFWVPENGDWDADKILATLAETYWMHQDLRNS